jgi:tRNA threonylcarbamoyl adenosine modification protein YjeE
VYCPKEPAPSPTNKSIPEKITPDAYADYFKPRPRDWHKGMSGHVLVIGGDAGYTGAPRMAAMAALRVGAGLVSVATRPEHVAEISGMHPEIMCHGVSTVDEIALLLKKADVIVLGPGLGQSDWAKMLFAAVLATEKPCVLDADALTLLARTALRCPHAILTPHPGEAATLLGITAAEVQQNRVHAIQEMVNRYSAVCVLKGAGSLVLDLDGELSLCDKGNPGMATAGTGDILAGVIGGLVSQGIPLPAAAKLGVYLHAVAGDLAAQALGERGLIATDLLPYLHQLVNPKARTYSLTDEASTARVAQHLAHACVGGTVIYLEGVLGAGKTTFVRYFLQALGYHAKVKSPTFTLVEPYTVAGKAVYHFDLYRVDKPEALEQIGVHEYFRPDTICLIEWPERGVGVLPPADIICKITTSLENRCLEMQACSAQGMAVMERIQLKE